MSTLPKCFTAIQKPASIPAGLVWRSPPADCVQTATHSHTVASSQHPLHPHHPKQGPLSVSLSRNSLPVGQSPEERSLLSESNIFLKGMHLQNIYIFYSAYMCTFVLLLSCFNTGINLDDTRLYSCFNISLLSQVNLNISLHKNIFIVLKHQWLICTWPSINNLNSSRGEKQVSTFCFFRGDGALICSTK